MCFIKVNLVLKTDRPTNRRTDGPTNLSIEATCRRLKRQSTVLRAFHNPWNTAQMKLYKIDNSVLRIKYPSNDESTG